jgi:hypothetical protein
MIGFYQDAGLLYPVLPTRPKRIMLPLAGGRKTASLYLGDPYTATVTAAASIGASGLSLSRADEFPASGSAVVYIPASGLIPASQIAISYTGINSLTSALTGVTGITQAVPAGCLIRPNIVWRTRGNILFLTTGSDTPGNVAVGLGLPVSPSASSLVTSYGVIGAPFISPLSSIAAGVENAVRLDINVNIMAGVQQEFTNWNVAVNAFFAFQSGDTSAIPSTAAGILPSAPGYVIRRDQSLPMAARLLPTNRQVLPTVPGFVIGQYRWRDQNTMDAAALAPTKWDNDTGAIGNNNFVTGIGDNDDLKPLNLIEGTGDQLNSVFLDIQDGCYFDGPTRYFLPGQAGLEFVDGTVLVHQLSAAPASQKPVFVGTWKMDSDGFYSIAQNYRYQAAAFVNDGSLQFQLNPRTGIITLNQALIPQLLFIGTLGGTGTDTYNLPVYPIKSITNMYIALGAGLGTAPLNAFSFDPDTGVITVTSTPGGIYSSGQPVYAMCNPGIAIEYEIAAAPGSTSNTRQLPVDLNPAFSGVTSGVVYLQHRQTAPSSIRLACDKPLIDIPATLTSIIDLVAYGPVYFNGDFALLSATVFGPLNGEVVPNVTMRVVVDAETWSGLINYEDPTAKEVNVTTGADGVVNMIYTPEADWGLYIPNAPASGLLAGLRTTTLTNDTIVLPEAVPISQVWDGKQWLVTLYQAVNNNPIYGMVGANVVLGQIPWITSGTPGTWNYKTNGQLQGWLGANTAQVTAAAGIGATSISVNQPGNFPASGQATVDDMVISYTGKTSNSLTGVTGLTMAVALGDLIFVSGSGQGPIVPIRVLDAAGNDQNSSLFTGEVVALVYPTTIPSSGTTGSYFLTFLQRVQIRLEVMDSGLFSNIVLLQMADPPFVIENPWLILNDAIQGRIGMYRLGSSAAIATIGSSVPTADSLAGSLIIPTL